jgi:hypothetical protein
MLPSSCAVLTQLYTSQSSHAGCVGRTTELPRERGRAVSHLLWRVVKFRARRLRAHGEVKVVRI